MLMTRETHFSLLCSDKYTQDCLAEGLAFMKWRKVPRAEIASEISVWMTHAVIRTAVSLDDHRWYFGYNVAEATNRAYRDNARVLRSTVESEKLRLPFPASKVYQREYNLPPVETHVLAVTAEREIIDLTFFCWREVELEIECPSVVWMRLTDNNETDDKLVHLDNADWSSYGVLCTGSEEINKRVAAGKEAASVIDRVLFT